MSGTDYNEGMLEPAALAEVGTWALSRELSSQICTVQSCSGFSTFHVSFLFIRVQYRHGWALGHRCSSASALAWELPLDLSTLQVLNIYPLLVLEEGML